MSTRVLVGAAGILIGAHLMASLAASTACADPNGASSINPMPLGPAIEDWIAHELLTYQTGLARFEVEAVARAIEAEATRHELSRDLILSVMRAESGFYNWARSSAGALGLMQIMPGTGYALAGELGIPWRGSRTLFDPVTNVRIGVAYLAELHSRFGSWNRALAAYNWGPTRIDRRLKRGRALPARYASRVLAALESPTAP